MCHFSILEFPDEHNVYNVISAFEIKIVSYSWTVRKVEIAFSTMRFDVVPTVRGNFDKYLVENLNAVYS